MNNQVEAFLLSVFIFNSTTSKNCPSIINNNGIVGTISLPQEFDAPTIKTMMLENHFELNRNIEVNQLIDEIKGYFDDCMVYSEDEIINKVK